MIWLFRTDKIGDSILTLPLDEWIPEGTEVKWFLSPSTLFLAENSQPKRRAEPLPKFWELIRQARLEKPQMAVVFHARWWVSLALFIARVPVRSGRLSQWHSFLFFNRGVRQTRSLSERHETHYGYELLRAALPELPEGRELPFLKLKAPGRSPLLEKWNLQPNNYYVIHPGMAGSARNWSQENYSVLMGKLTEFSNVVVTGTTGDQAFLSSLEPKWKHHPKVRWTVGQLSLNELLGILAKARSVVAPSTGVLHLAASLGTIAVGIYSPVLVHHPRRWGPRGEKVSVLLPQVTCPATKECLGQSCAAWDCMNQITVEQIVEQLMAPQQVTSE